MRPITPPRIPVSALFNHRRTIHTYSAGRPTGGITGDLIVGWIPSTGGRKNADVDGEAAGAGAGSDILGRLEGNWTGVCEFSGACRIDPVGVVEDDLSKEVRLKWRVTREATPGVLGARSCVESAAETSGVSFFLKNLPKSCGLRDAGGWVSAGDELGGGCNCVWPVGECGPCEYETEERESADEDAGVWAISGVIGRLGLDRRLVRRKGLLSMPGERRVSDLGGTRATGAGPQTSTGSKIARPISSMPRLLNFAIFASVPASTMMLVITLCACRLYSGMIVRRVDALDATEEKEATDVDEPE